MDGGIDAFRRECYQPMKADQLPDFVLPLLIRKQGFRVVYEPEAILVEESLEQASAEFRMRVRVTLRALWALRDMRALMNPVKYGVFAWQLLSHKVLRYLAFMPLMALIPINVALYNTAIIYNLAAYAQVVFYALAISAVTTEAAGPIRGLPYYFVLLNAAAAVAFSRFLRGKKQVVWQPRLGA